MRIGQLELQIKELRDGSWQYHVQSMKDSTKETFGYRQTEHQARDAGLEDASLMRAFC